MGGAPDNKKLYEIAEIVKSWITWRPEPANMSRDFWMPDQCCRMCYECDSQFTVFNRRHHCRLCGRVFCAKCTTNSVVAPSDEPKSRREDGDRIRVCNYCLKQWKQGTNIGDSALNVSSPGLSSSPSSLSLVSNQSSSCTCNSVSSAGSGGYSTGPFQHVSRAIGQSPHQSEQMDLNSRKQEQETSHGEIEDPDASSTFSHQFGSYSRSDEEDDDYPFHRSDSEVSLLGPDNCYGTLDSGRGNYIYEPLLVHPNEEHEHPTCDSNLLPENCQTEQLDFARKHEGKAAVPDNDVQSGDLSLDVPKDAVVEAVDWENNGLLWLPPEPEDEEDEKDTFWSDEDDDDLGDDIKKEWGYLRSNSFGGGESQTRDRSKVEHQKAMKRVVDGHFKALIAQLLQAENLHTTDDNKDGSWLDIITTLSWEAANFLKPDTSMGSGMDPGGYVKVKCVACGHRNESVVVKGVVCKKNVAHRRMTAKVSKARLLLLGGALEYQRVANHLSSVDTLLQQEMDHLKMAVAKIEAHHPSVLLVEKSVSRYAQDYLLAKGISLVLNVKRPLLERIARCSGAHIVPSIDNLSATKLGYCDSFHVEKFLEDLGSAGQPVKKVTKTLMFFEGCPRPLGCTILLKGAGGDELKKIKNVVHYGVFAAYHLALETSFLADEGASLPELPLTSPIKVALPDRPSTIDRSISVISGYDVLPSDKTQGPQDPSNPVETRNEMNEDIKESSITGSMSESQSSLSKNCESSNPDDDPGGGNMQIRKNVTDVLGPQSEKPPAVHHSDNNRGPGLLECCVPKTLDYLNENLDSNHLSKFEASGEGVAISSPDSNILPSKSNNSELITLGQHHDDHDAEFGPLQEEFPPSPSDQQSILVSLSTRCVWKGSVCERAHLFRIKYYGNFDKPLGRFLQDQLFDQEYKCRSCEMPSEAHIHCYTHQEGTLTISVKRSPGFLLSGEKEGKIWMWHRCLRCPRIHGFPPATKRVVMSAAAWGLSFGKFLELSFSNHAAASRVASCGHSLHRDCLRFYGFGRMVACFRYAPINVHAVYLPPSELQFNYYEQEWIQRDFEEVKNMADLLFTEVSQAIHQISEKIKKETRLETPESVPRITILESMLQMEKKEFEDSLCAVLYEGECDKPVLDILEINRIRRKLLFQAYVWDQRLTHVARTSMPNFSSSIRKERPVTSHDKIADTTAVSRSERGFSSWNSSLVNVNPDALTEGAQGQTNSPSGTHEGTEINRSSSFTQDADLSRSCGVILSDHSGSLVPTKSARRSQSEGHFPTMENLSDNLDAAWTGNQWPATVASKEKTMIVSPDTLHREFAGEKISAVEPITGSHTKEKLVAGEIHSSNSELPPMSPSEMENPRNWVRIPFSILHWLFQKNSSTNTPMLSIINNYTPVYISSLRDLVHRGGARLLLPMASTDYVLPIYDDEPTSIISYALVSSDYQKIMSGEMEKQKDSLESSASLSILESASLFSRHSSDDAPSESLRSMGSVDESILSSGSRSFPGLDPLLYSNSLHARVSFSDDGPPGKTKYSVTSYFAKQFEALRQICRASELDYVRSLSRCKKWGAQGGKSNVFFAKTLDDRFIIKQVTKTELESFIKFAPLYFKYLSESISTGCPTCLAKILGIYQVVSKQIKGGKESRMDVLVMENLLYRRNITRLYDLKGSSRSRYNPDASGSNKVLLDQNLLEAMPTSPIFLGTKAKRLLERAVWNDTAFLASVDVMDYSLLVGVDEEKHELVVGIIDFMRQYTWDKHLETWVKAAGILGGPKNAAPTVISPKQYKRRFRKAMTTYFLMVPDQWSSSLSLPSPSQANLCKENSKDRITTQV